MKYNLKPLKTLAVALASAFTLSAQLSNPTQDPFVYEHSNTPGGELTYRLTNDWIYSSQLGSYTELLPGTSQKVRGMDYHNGLLYFCTGNGRQIEVLDPLTGEHHHTVTLPEHAFQIEVNGQLQQPATIVNNDLHFDHAGNCLVSSSVGDFMLYRLGSLDGETTTADLIIHNKLKEEYPDMNLRFDAFDVFGDVQNDAIIMAASANDMIALRWNISRGSLSSIEIKYLEPFYPTYSKPGPGASPRIKIIDENQFIIDGFNTFPTLYNMSGMRIDAFQQDESIPAQLEGFNQGHNGIYDFEMVNPQGQTEYFLCMAARNTVGGGTVAPSTFAIFRYKDASRHLSEAQRIFVFPKDGFGTNSNPHRSALPVVDVQGSKAHIYLYAGENGIARYTLDNAPAAPVTDIVVNLLTPGTLSQEIANQGADAAQITKISIFGTLDEADLTYIKTSLPALTELNISGTTNTTLPDEWLKDNQTIEKVILSDNLQEIPTRCFASCSKLGSVRIPDGIHRVKGQAFSGTPYYNTLPDGDLYFGKSYYGYKGVMEQGTTVTVQPGTLYIEESALAGFIQLTGVILPESIIRIEYWAFLNCTSLSTVRIPDSVQLIEQGVFANCLSLKTITLPESIHNLWWNIFNGCSSLTNVVLPSGLNDIYDGVFAGCTAVSEIRSLAVTPPAIYDNGLGDIPSSAVVYVPETSIPAYREATGWNRFSDYRPLPAEPEPGTVTVHVETPGQLFQAVGKLGVSPSTINKLTITGQLNETDYASLRTDYTSLVELNLQGISNTTLPAGFFSGNTIIRKVVLPANLIELPEESFYNCSSLTDIVMPAGIRRVRFHAINGTPYYDSLPDGDICFGESYYRYKGLMPQNTYITIPSGIRHIEDYAFSLCSNLVLITLPDGLVSIGSNAFSHCSSLFEISLPSTVDSIGSYAFYECRSLQSFTLPDNITSISERTFQGCMKFDAITIPAAVTDIYESAYAGCPEVTVIRSYAVNPPVVHNQFSFDSSHRNAALFVPKASVTAYRKARIWDEFTDIRAIDGSPWPKPDATSLSVDVQVPGTLDQQIAYFGAKASNITSLAVTGTLNSDDFEYIRKYMTSISVLDMSGLSTNSLTNSCLTSFSTLTKVIVPNGLTELPASIFYDCKALQSVVLSDSITVIHSGAFDRCSSLTDIRMPSRLQIIERHAFVDCGKLSIVTLPQSIEKVEYQAFANCNSLETVTIPATVDRVQTEAFLNTPFINSLSDGPVIFGKSFYAYKGTMPDTVRIPDSIRYIEGGSLNNSSTVRKVVMGASIYNIERYAFRGSTNISSLACSTIKAPAATSASFADIPVDAVIFVPSQSIEDYKRAMGWNRFKNYQALDAAPDPEPDPDPEPQPDSLNVFVSTPGTLAEEITKAGADAAQLSNIIISGTLNGTDFDYIKNNMTSLTHLNLLNIDNTTLPNECFSRNTTLTTVILPGSITEVPSAIFFDCTSLNSVVMPDQVQIIHPSAFQGCLALAKVTMPASLRIIGRQAFVYCSSIRRVTLPATIEKIELDAFLDCTSLEDINIPSGIDRVEGCAFQGTPFYETLNDGPICFGRSLYAYKGIVPAIFTLSSGIRYIESYAFKDAVNLQEINFSDQLQLIDSYAFMGCSSLTNLKLPNSVSHINEGAFQGAISLRTVSFGTGTRYIAQYSFQSCTAVGTIYSHADTPPIGDHNTFSDVSASARIIVPSKSIPLYRTADAWSRFSNFEAIETTPDPDPDPDPEPQPGDVTLRTLTLIASPDTDSPLITAQYPDMSEVTIESAPNPGYQFSAWNNSGNKSYSPRHSFIISEDQTFIAEYTPETYTLSVESGDHSAGTAEGSGLYDYNTEVAIRAIPAPGYVFSQWSDADRNPNRTVRIVGDCTYTAYFIPESQVDNGSNRVSVSIDTENEQHGYVEVIVTAESIPGFRFTHWSDGSRENPRLINHREEINLIAYFEPGTAVEVTQLTEVSVYTDRSGILHIDGAERLNADYHILDASGRHVYTGRAAEHQLPRGVYIIVLNDRFQKFAI